MKNPLALGGEIGDEEGSNVGIEEIPLVGVHIARSALAVEVVPVVHAGRCAPLRHLVVRCQVQKKKTQRKYKFKS